MDEEGKVSAPLFIRTPYMQATRVNAGGTVPAVLETVASQAGTKTTTLLLETLRFWFAPTGLGGRSAGYVQLAVLAPDTHTIHLERHEVAALDAGAYAGPVSIQLDLLLPPGHALQLLSTPEEIAPGLPAVCHVVVQGGELG